MAKLKDVFKHIEDLSHSDVVVRRKAARKLGELGDAHAVQPLCLALRDDDPHVRRAAAASLGRLRDPSAMPPLQEALKDKREGLRYAAALAISHIGRHHSEFAFRAVSLIMQAALKDKRGATNPYMDALTGMGLAAASPLCLEYNSHREEFSQQYAEAALSQILYHANLDVTRHLLADNSLSPAQVWAVLEMLEAHRPTGYFASRRFPPALRICELAVVHPNEPDAVQQGAKRVLEYLSLGRASQFHDPNAGTQLLRMASPMPPSEGGATLLRGSEANEEARPHKISLDNKLVSVWHNLLAKCRHWFYFD